MLTINTYNTTSNSRLDGNLNAPVAINKSMLAVKL